MKKSLLMFLAVSASFILNAQILFQQDFESGIAPMTLVDNDGHTPAASVAAYSAAWTAANPSFGNGTNVAISNSWYSPAAAADDWMITPAINIPTPADGVLLLWEAKAQDASYPDGYQVLISTTGTNLTDFTNVAFVIDHEMPDWQSRGVSLAAYAGQTIHIAFRNNSFDQFLLLVDNIKVGSVQANDVSVVKLTNDRFVLSGTNAEVTGEITNNGSEPLTSFDVTWSNGVNDYTETITLSTPLGYSETATFTHSTPLSVADAITYDFTVTVGNPNGNADGDLTNNQATGVVSGVTYIPSKKMLSEEATGTWCGWCPRGTEWMDYMTEFHADEFVGVAVHNQDPMAVTAYDSGLNGFPGFSGYPSVIIDRNAIWDPSEMEDILPDYLARVAPVAPEVTASIDVATKTLTANASAEFVTQLSGVDYRFNVVLTEDGVTGTGSGYAQTNYYAGAGAPTDPIPGYGADWDALPATVPAADMVYNHVGRALLGGWAGTAASIPTDLLAGDVVEKEYVLTNFNTAWNPYNMHAIVMVIDNATGEVLNVNNSEEIEVICPTSFGAQTTVTPSSGNNGAIVLTPPASTFGFGGYTYLWSNGETTPDISGLAVGTYTLVITDRIGCSQTIEVVVGEPSSVEDIASLTSFGLTPNPASTVSVLTASFAQAVDATVELVNLDGRVVANASFGKATTINHTFQLNDLAAGMYLVKMSVGNQVHTERLMVTK